MMTSFKQLSNEMLENTKFSLSGGKIKRKEHLQSNPLKVFGFSIQKANLGVGAFHFSQSEGAKNEAQ